MGGSRTGYHRFVVGSRGQLKQGGNSHLDRHAVGGGVKLEEILVLFWVEDVMLSVRDALFLLFVLIIMPNFVFSLKPSIGRNWINR